jgi:hypothetical protein
MPYDIPLGFALVVVDIRNPNQPSVDSMRFGIGLNSISTITATDWNRIATYFRNHFKGFIGTTWTVGPVNFYYHDASGLKLYTDPTLTAGLGSATGISAPQVAQIVKKSSDFLGRAFRGRVYVPGVPEADVNDSGDLTSTRIAAINTDMAALLADVNGDTAVDNMVILHSQGSGNTPTIIRSLTCQAKVGTIRHRVRR